MLNGSIYYWPTLPVLLVSFHTESILLISFHTEFIRLPFFNIATYRINLFLAVDCHTLLLEVSYRTFMLAVHSLDIAGKATDLC